MECVNSYLDQDYQKIKHECLLNRKLFCDETFPPNNESLFRLIKRPNVHWKRTFEITHNPKLSSDDLNAYDLESADNW